MVVAVLDECSRGIHTCSRRLNYTSGIANDYINQANCTDAEGSFSCECLPGYLKRGQSLGTIPAGVYCESAKFADPQPTAPQNGHMTYSDQLWTVGIGDEMAYGCNDGYALNLNGGANETVTCYGGGTTAAPTADWPSYWSGITCDPVACTGTPPTSRGNESLIISSGRLNLESRGTFEKGSRFWGTDSMGTVTLGRSTVIGPGATMTFQRAVSHPTDIKFGGATVTNSVTVNTSDTLSGITSITGAGVVTSMEVIASEVIVTALTLGDGNTVTIDGNDDLTPTPTWNPGITDEFRCDDGMRRLGDTSMTCQGVNSTAPTALRSNATTSTCEKENPGIDVEKTTNGMDSDTGPGAPLEIGGTATFQYTVVNTGNVPKYTVTSDTANKHKLTLTMSRGLSFVGAPTGMSENDKTDTSNLDQCLAILVFVMLVALEEQKRQHGSRPSLLLCVAACAALPGAAAIEPVSVTIGTFAVASLSPAKAAIAAAAVKAAAACGIPTVTKVLVGLLGGVCVGSVPGTAAYAAYLRKQKVLQNEEAEATEGASRPAAPAPPQPEEAAEGAPRPAAPAPPQPNEAAPQIPKPASGDSTEEIVQQGRELGALLTKVEGVNASFYSATFNGRGGMWEERVRVIELGCLLGKVRALRERIHGVEAGRSVGLHCECSVCTLARLALHAEQRLKMDSRREEKRRQKIMGNAEERWRGGGHEFNGAWRAVLEEAERLCPKEKQRVWKEGAGQHRGANLGELLSIVLSSQQFTETQRGGGQLLTEHKATGAEGSTTREPKLIRLLWEALEKGSRLPFSEIQACIRGLQRLQEEEDRRIMRVTAEGGSLETAESRLLLDSLGRYLLRVQSDLFVLKGKLGHLERVGVSTTTTPLPSFLFHTVPRAREALLREGLESVIQFLESTPEWKSRQGAQDMMEGGEVDVGSMNDQSEGGDNWVCRMYADALAWKDHVVSLADGSLSTARFRDREDADGFLRHCRDCLGGEGWGEDIRAEWIRSICLGRLDGRIQILSLEEKDLQGAGLKLKEENLEELVQCGACFEEVPRRLTAHFCCDERNFQMDSHRGCIECVVKRTFLDRNFGGECFLRDNNGKASETFWNLLPLLRPSTDRAPREGVVRMTAQWRGVEKGVDPSTAAVTVSPNEPLIPSIQESDAFLFERDPTGAQEPLGGSSLLH
uniref:Uncharacterized protein n=1 Tax=Chromera velia CCMP2878 TaxID=1169474 RepID=A0A0G4GQK5_9ALVE|eukprot:Cvel_22934.t1-p1 / transcript=Cvel_22934.t1 / gene=Cvel_22934 / organism=Chromera_velia_CCMP2878 / gene_product=hypothetical protein / transcript_product=hypothetical protein / location=Cvel_scaffold2307:10294-15528(-) / protein_length=1176 / sequence_SO=supercontig / SO=protein_coding / is_pseudo=false